MPFHHHILIINFVIPLTNDDVPHDPPDFLKQVYNYVLDEKDEARNILTNKSVGGEEYSRINKKFIRH
jgi:hypothetical protein